MNSDAVPQMQGGIGLRVLPALAVVAAVGVACGILFAGSAAAAPPGAGGQIQACYKVKGKPKGGMRVVAANRKCRRGERKLSWTTAGSPGQQGAAGTQGAPGSGGAPGSSGTNGSEASVAALETEIAALALQVESLEGILAGVTNSALLDAVAAVPAVESLCTQATGLTDQLNSVATVLDGITLGGVLPLGLILTVPDLAALPSYACP